MQDSTGTQRLASPRRTARRKQSKTITVVAGESGLRLPHEHDESSDSQRSAPRQVMRQAAEDLKQGKVDTGVGPPMDETYRRLRDSDPAEPGNEPPHDE